MAAVYTTLDDVKKVLRSSSGERVRFSDNVKTVEVKHANKAPNLDITFDRNGLILDPSVEGAFTIRIEFSSIVAFDVYRIEEAYENKLHIGSGNISSLFTSSDGLLQISPSCWTGTIVAGDYVQLQYDIHMSNEVAEYYIENTEVMIDQMIYDVLAQAPATGETRVWPLAADVPEAVSVAATYLTAYYIFTDVFADRYLTREDKKLTLIDRWKTRGEEYLKRYISNEAKIAPSLISFPKMIDQFGIKDVQSGMTGTITSVQDDLERDAEVDEIFSFE